MCDRRSNRSRSLRIPSPRRTQGNSSSGCHAGRRCKCRGSPVADGGNSARNAAPPGPPAASTCRSESSAPNPVSQQAPACSRIRVHAPRVLVEREPRLAHIGERGAARFGAGIVLDKDQKPAASQRIGRCGAAVRQRSGVSGSGRGGSISVPFGTPTAVASRKRSKARCRGKRHEEQGSEQQELPAARGADPGAGLFSVFSGRRRLSANQIAAAVAANANHWIA